MTQQNDLISIIVPVYNMEQYLDRCMNSIWQQTYKNLEIILVDDGSTDRSGQMCDAYAAKDGRIRVVHKQNGGLSDARNAGLAIASGSYIGYVDSDDWIEPFMYEKMYQACIEHQSQVAICRYAQEFKDHTVLGGNDDVISFSRETLLKIYIGGHDDYIIYNSVWSKLFKREIVEDVQFPVGRNSEDIMYTTRAFCKAERGVYIDTCLYHYVMDRENSIMNVKRGERMFRDEIPFWREHTRHIRDNVSEELGDYAAYYFYRRLLQYYQELNSRKETRKEAKRLARLMQEERMEILKIYDKSEESTGDKLRMKLFLTSPEGYLRISQLYEKVVIPIRCRKGKQIW